MALETTHDNKTKLKRVWDQLFPALISIVIAVIIGGLLLVANGRDPLAAYLSLWQGAFGSFGRVYIGGEEKDVDVAWKAAEAAINSITGRAMKGGGGA